MLTAGPGKRSKGKGDAKNRMNVKGLLSRILVYVVGLFIMAFGVSLSLKSNLGVSPVNSLPNEISLVFKSFGINLSLGNAVIIIFSCYVLVQILIKRRKFPLIDLTQVIFSVIFGYFTNFTGMITDANNYLTNLPLRLVFMAVSMVFIALGVSIYMNAKLVNMPMEGMTLAIAEKLGKPFARVKVVVDCSTVILALVFLHGIKGVGIGTVLAAICVGLLVRPIQKLVSPALTQFCFGSVEREEEVQAEGCVTAQD